MNKWKVEIIMRDGRNVKFISDEKLDFEKLAKTKLSYFTAGDNPELFINLKNVLAIQQESTP